MTATIVPTQTHDEELERVLMFDDAGCGCPMCHTGMTRECSCGGRVHNEMHEVLVEMCFVCDIDWVPVAEAAE